MAGEAIQATMSSTPLEGDHVVGIGVLPVVESNAAEKASCA